MINFLRTSAVLLFCSVFVITTSCERDDEDPAGPNLQDRFGPFEVDSELSLSRDSVNFAAGENVVFNAEFNKNVNWVITITGLESGAVIQIEDFSRIINSENATWTGRTSQLPFFKAEPCSVELTVPDEEDFMGNTAEVVVLEPRVYSGSLYTDFEEGSGQDIAIVNPEFELVGNTGISDAINPAQGDFILLMEGTDNVVPNYFVGIVELSPQMNDNTYVQFPTTVPENLFFNFFLYNDGRDHGICVIQFAFDTNDNGVFDDGPDEIFQLDGDYPLDFTGWRKFSHTMADVGIPQNKLQKIVMIRVLLISVRDTQPSPKLEVQLGLDYVTFTSGAPFQL